MKINRRRFVTYAALGSGVVLIGAGSHLYSLYDREAAPSFKILSVDEIKIVNSIAEAMFPGDKEFPKGNEVQVAEAFDEYLAAIDRSTANLLRMLLHTIEEVPWIGFSGFTARALDERIEILQAWDESTLSARRSAFMSIKLLFGTTYCEDKRVLSAAGIRFACG